MKPARIIITGIVFILVAGACATPGKPTRDARMADMYMAEAHNLENANDLPAAMERYKLALTVDPDNGDARAGLQRLTAQLEQLADERYDLGMKYYRQGKYSLARKEFLTALRYRPDHPKASKMLISRDSTEISRYIFHVIQPGESLSMIAENYYGDKKKYDVIARFNNLEDATRIRTGQRIMIPDLGARGPADQDPPGQSYIEHVLKSGESVSRLAQRYYGDYRQFHIIAQFNDLDDATSVKVGHTIKIPRVAGLPFHLTGDAQSMEIVTQAAPLPEPDMAALTNDSIAAPADDEQLVYRDAGIALFNQGKYEDAVFELIKAVEAMPADSRTRDYLSRSYLEAGKDHLAQQEFDAAVESFESALQYDPGCESCRSYIEKARSAPLLARRQAGMAEYRKKNYPQAVSQWEHYLLQRSEDMEIRTFISDAHYQVGLAHFKRGEFLEAKKGFESALEYDNTCDQCADNISRSLNNYKEAHYNKGIAFFGREKLPEAITEWQKVYDLDPGYKDVASNLSKSKELLKKLDRIKRSQNE